MTQGVIPSSLRTSPDADAPISAGQQASHAGAHSAGARPIAACSGVFFLDLSTAARHRVVREGKGGQQPDIRKASRTPNGWLAVRPTVSDVMWLSPLSMSAHDEAPIAPGAVFDPGFPHGYWFYIVGSDAGLVFSHGCELDMRLSRFADHGVVQTLLFRTSVTVIRDDVKGVPGFHLLGCNSLAHHVSRKVQHIQTLHGGRQIAIGDLPGNA